MQNPLAGLWLGRLYRQSTGRRLRLRSPVGFTEKIQLAKLRWRSPLMTRLADKVQVKAHVREVLGAEWVTPTLFAGPALPPRHTREWPTPFVIKANHRSGANHHVLRLDDTDWPLIERRVEGWLAHSYGGTNREWAYRDIPRQVLVEPWLDGADIDYKFYMFGGEFGFCAVIWDRTRGVKAASMDRGWQRLPFVMNDTDGDPRPDEIPGRPSCYDEMVAGAEKLARGFPFVRIDLYVISGRPRFGEVTFYPQSGFFRVPEADDALVGAMWPDGMPTV
jgi:hypothetical protein